MAYEIEVKLRIADPAALRTALQEAGARRESRVLEVNTLFDTPTGGLRSAGRGLRIRECQSLDGAAPPPALLTLKGPAAPGPFKTREELETGVADSAALSQILAGLGYRPVLCYEKRRETWSCGECEITLDELPKLGWFAEIEGPDGPAIKALQMRLQLDAAEVVAETYVALTVRHGALESGGGRALRF
jgi:predicted adenylyl cyclase CyaB